MEFNFEERLQNALEYWTPERIAATAPLDKIFPTCGGMGGDDGSVPSYLTVGPGSDDGSSDEEGSLVTRRDANHDIPPEVIQDFERFSISEDRLKQMRPVDENELANEPYQSVGKVCVRKDGDIIQDIHVTAFYIGQPVEKNGMKKYRVLTVAHIFDKKIFQKAKELVFITPSNEIFMINPHEKQCHPSYREKRKLKLGNRAVVNIPFDLCVLPVYPVGGHVDSRKCCIADNYTPFELVAEGDIEGETFIAIGYPKSSHKYSGRMTLKWGKKLSTQTLKNYEHPTVQIDNFAADGMSGGPWIIEGHNNLLVYGIQSSNTLQYPRPSNATSPYFTEELLKPLDLKYRVE